MIYPTSFFMESFVISLMIYVHRGIHPSAMILDWWMMKLFLLAFDLKLNHLLPYVEWNGLEDYLEKVWCTIIVFVVHTFLLPSFFLRISYLTLVDIFIYFYVLCSVASHCVFLFTFSANVGFVGKSFSKISICYFCFPSAWCPLLLFLLLLLFVFDKRCCCHDTGSHTFVFHGLYSCYFPFW